MFHTDNVPSHSPRGDTHRVHGDGSAKFHKFCLDGTYFVQPVSRVVTSALVGRQIRSIHHKTWLALPQG